MNPTVPVIVIFIIKTPLNTQMLEFQILNTILEYLDDLTFLSTVIYVNSRLILEMQRRKATNIFVLVNVSENY